MVCRPSLRGGKDLSKIRRKICGHQCSANGEQQTVTLGGSLKEVISEFECSPFVHLFQVHMDGDTDRGAKKNGSTTVWKECETAK